MEFSEVVSRRRSVRRYLDTPVEQEKLDYVLECARLAPSWSNRQCWGFVVVCERETIERVAGSGHRINRWLTGVPVLVAACGEPSKSGTARGVGFWAVDVAIAMEHLVLAATDAGLGTCWIGVFDEDVVRSELAIPEGVGILALTPLGYPAEKRGVGDCARRAAVGAHRRKPMHEVVHWERWG